MAANRMIGCIGHQVLPVKPRPAADKYLYFDNVDSPV